MLALLLSLALSSADARVDAVVSAIGEKDCPRLSPGKGLVVLVTANAGDETAQKAVQEVVAALLEDYGS